jgi:OmcA/MtrC family decaheme c-type cytochrome
MATRRNGNSPIRFVALILLVCATLASQTKSPYTAHEKAFYADPAVVAFVRPGLVITINTASVSSSGAITTEFTITDPQGLGLDRTGVQTPGAVSTSFIAAYIPKDQPQYTAYTTRTASGAAVPSTIQAATDSGGIYTDLGNGRYRYSFNTQAPSGFDPTVTHTIGIYGSRDLTAFEMGTNYASTTYNFVPNGSAVVVTRDVIRTQSCDTCHDQLSFHGGSRRGVELCVLCHTPQTLDPDTGNTVDMKVMIHKIHMGSQLPSVIAGTPYQIVGFQGAVSDWSTVNYPADPRRCESCHQQNSGATQAANYATKPTRDSCGSCHDDVNFATGQNHAGGPQISDHQCAFCHIPQGELEFDASVKGAHVVPTDSTMLSGLVTNIVSVQGGSAGTSPTVTFTVKDSAGNGVPLSQLNNISLLMTGPTTDYGYTSFGSDVTSSGYVSESASGAGCSPDGTCSYTFQHAVPGGAKGSYAVGIEARRTDVLLPGTTKEMSVKYGAVNKVVYFSVDGSPVQPRRTIVDVKSCNGCHSFLSEHGANRNQPELCVFCHNPSFTSSDSAPVGLNLTLLIHRIHNSEDTRYPALSPQGSPGDTRKCAQCHVNDSQETLPTGLNAVTDPSFYINPVQPVTSACTACHVEKTTASHALAETTPLGESCVVCHGSGAAFGVNQVHAQY